MITILSNPAMFFGVLLGLFVVSVLIIFSVLREDSRFKNIDNLFKQETAAREESEKNAVNLQQEVAKLNKELSLKEELYQGLKSQYEELERDMERLTAQSQPTEPTQTKKEESSLPKPSIVDLLKSLNKT